MSNYSETCCFPGGSVKNLPAMWETQVQSLGREDPLEEEMATHSSILAWRSPWTEEPGGLQSMGSQMATHSSIGASQWCGGKKIHLPMQGDTGSIPGSGRYAGVGNGNPIHHSRLGNSMDRGAWWGYSPRRHRELNATERSTLEWLRLLPRQQAWALCLVRELRSHKQPGVAEK